MSPSPWLPADPLLPMIPAACLALVFLQAAVHKLRDADTFMMQLQAYRLLPDKALWLGRLLAPLELMAAVLLLLATTRVWGAVLAGLLLLLYALAMAVNLRRGRSLDCGCGGTPQPLSWGLVVRNLLMALVAVGAGLPASSRPLELADAGLLAGSVLAWLMLLAAFNQVLRQAGAWRQAAR